MERAASVARQAKEAGIKSRVQFMVTPGSDTIDQTIRRDGQMQLLDDIGGTVLANACGGRNYSIHSDTSLVGICLHGGQQHA